ncbi:MAG: RnfABCDGE type electron transport complex subunit D [Bacilli bacterium]|nr:RnfABCDGE type electron transport complex subunit D [Bacilli bacterium]
MIINKETSPHIRRKDTLMMMFIDVIIALMPVIIMSIVTFHWAAVRNIYLSIAVMIACELLYLLIRYKKEGFKEHFSATSILGPCISGAIYGLITPAYSNPEWLMWFIIPIGAIFGMVIGKLVFGGTGQNIFNPAATGMVFTKLCFGNKFVYKANWFSQAMDVTTGATQLDGGSYSLFDLMIGSVPGTIGEVCKIAILIGMIYLLVRRAGDFHVIVSYLGTFIFLYFIAGFILKAGNVMAPGSTKPFSILVGKNGLSSTSVSAYVAQQLLSGGVLFAATYMVTDPVTMPVNRPGRILYGIIIGVSNVFIRLFGALPEGTVFSILIGNMVAPALDYYKWATNKYSWKNILAMASIIVVAALIIVWALCVRVFK